jgi:hypothetical protein
MITLLNIKTHTCKFGPVHRILMDAKLQILPKRLIEFVVIFLILWNLIEHLQTLLHKIFPDNLHISPVLTYKMPMPEPCIQFNNHYK